MQNTGSDFKTLPEAKGAPVTSGGKRIPRATDAERRQATTGPKARIIGAKAVKREQARKEPAPGSSAWWSF